MPEYPILRTVGADEPDVESVEGGVIFALDLWTDGARRLLSEHEFLVELDKLFADVADDLREEVVSGTSTAIHAVETVDPAHY